MNALKPQINLISFVGEGVFSPVLDSQVLMPLAFLGQQAPHVRRALLILTSIRYRKDPRVPPREEAIRANLPGVTVLFKYRTPPGIPFQQRLWAGPLRTALRECGYAATTGPIVVQCRGRETTAAAVAAKRHDPRLKVLYDVRGAGVDEINLAGPLGWYLRWTANRAIRIALRGADAVNTVSHKLAQHLRDSGAWTRPIPSTVIGCCADKNRFYFDPAVRATRRKELGFDQRFVVCYSGAMSHWQRPDALAAAFAAIRSAMRDAHLLILSREPKQFLHHLARLSVPSDAVTVHAAAHEQVASYLMAADVALLLRENSLTNQVASPVKFAEYLRCGLPVLLTPYIGDLSAVAVKEGVGLTVDFPVQAEQVIQAARTLRERLAAEGDQYRAACSRLAAERFSWDVHVGELIRLYETLARQSS
jgi:glycosyltransferase involved in cell wall biosynthesis